MNPLSNSTSQLSPIVDQCYPDGSYYKGQAIDFVRQGFGKMLLPNGDRYKGFWNNDLKEGYGIMRSQNGDRYKGFWSKDLKEGFGIMCFQNGDRYEGFWKNGLRDGRGVQILSSSNIKITGTYKNDLLEGEVELHLIGYSTTFKVLYVAGKIIQINNKPIYQTLSILNEGLLEESSSEDNIEDYWPEESEEEMTLSTHSEPQSPPLFSDAEQEMTWESLNSEGPETFFLSLAIVQEQSSLLLETEKDETVVDNFQTNETSMDVMDVTEAEFSQVNFTEPVDIIETSVIQTVGEEFGLSYAFEDGSTLVRKFTKEQVNGQCKWLFDDGLILEGFFENGNLVNGVGILKFPNGDEYNGAISGKQAEGYGTWKFADERKIEGIFSKDQFVGITGILIYPEKGVYKGEISQGQAFGLGCWTYASGVVLEGYFSGCKLVSFKGKITFPNIGIYEGDFFENKPHGKGCLTYFSGTILEGAFVAGYLSNGIKKYSSGIIENGTFNKNQLIEGVRLYPNNILEEGLFEGVKLFQGKKIYPSGWVQEGRFRDNLFQGVSYYSKVYKN